MSSVNFTPLLFFGFALGDTTTRTFAATAAAVWALAGIYAFASETPGKRLRLAAFYLPAAAGGIACMLASNALSFYAAYTLTALSSVGLIAWNGDERARKAARIYLALTVTSEALLLAALMMAAGRSWSWALPGLREEWASAPEAGLVMWLLTASLMIKCGSTLFAGVLPLSYENAPAGAAAALAGASVKIGLLALLWLLPLGIPGFETWGAAYVVIGLSSAFLGVALGLLARTPRAMLGYSSASQMGLAFVAAGAALIAPQTGAIPALAAVVAFTVHHALAKSALVLGSDAGRARGSALGRALDAVLLALPAAALIGAPLTSGFVAKLAIKAALSNAAAAPIVQAAASLLPVSSVATGLLMIRFLVAVRRSAPPKRPLPRLGRAAWYALTGLSAAVALTGPWSFSSYAREHLFDAHALWSATWPALAAVALAAAARIARLSAPSIETGDLLAYGYDAGLRTIARLTARAPERARSATRTGAKGVLIADEQRLFPAAVAMGAFVALAVLLALLAARAG